MSNQATSRATPVPVLKPDTIYCADNGRLICLHCAGASAKYTGHDISGQEVFPITGKAKQLWLQEFPNGTTCEAGCTELKP